MIIETETPAPTPSPTPPPETDLTLVKTDSPDPVEAGGTLTYMVTVTNTGDIAAEDVTVTDALPDDVTLISATPGQGSCVGSTCNLGTIPAGEAVAIAYVVMVHEDAPAVITNVACVASSTTDPDLTNNCDDEETEVPGGSPTPTALPATSTPKGLPETGGLPGGDTTSGRLLIGLGLAFVLMGMAAAVVARRRALSAE